MAANLSIETTGNAIHEQVLRLVWTWFDLFDLLELATVCKRWSVLVNNTVAHISFKHIALPLGYSNRAFDVWSRIRYSDVESLSMTTANGSAADVHSMFARAPTTLRSVQLTSRNGGDRLSSYDTVCVYCFGVLIRLGVCLFALQHLTCNVLMLLENGLW